MVTYEIKTVDTILATDLGPDAPAIRLAEGRPAKGQKRPLDLAPGETTIVVYPLIGGSIECDVKRTDTARS